MALRNQGSVNGGFTNDPTNPLPGVRYGRFMREVVGFGGGSNIIAKWLSIGGGTQKRHGDKAAAAVKGLGNPTGLGNPPH
jgi:hypothetical protein